MYAKEEKAEGTISRDTYYQYFRAGGSIIFLVFAFSVFASLEVGDLITFGG